MATTTTPLRFRAYQVIKEMLFAGDFMAGEVIDISDLAQRLNLGRSPIREALLHLECDGLMEILPKKGARVVPLSEPDRQVLNALIGYLEADIVRQVAETVSEDALTPLRHCLGAMARAVELRRHEDWCRTQELFFRELHQLCPNRYLSRTASENRDKYLRAHFTALRLYSQEERRLAVQEALDLTDFLANQDVNSATSHFRECGLRRTTLERELLQSHGIQRS